MSRQGTDYAHIKKVYSIWIVANPAQKKIENTVSRLVTAEQHIDGQLTPAPKAAQLSEIWFLNLGVPGQTNLPVLEMLDAIFASDMEISEKTAVLRDRLDMKMSTALTKEMEVMLNMELAIEARAQKKGEAIGVIKTLLALQSTPGTIMTMVTEHFDGDQQKAKAALNGYLAEHPQDGSYLRGDTPWLHA